MAVDIVTSILINRPRDVVAAYAADPASAPRWYENIKDAEWLTQPPLRVGSQFRFVAQFLGRRLDYTYEVIEHVPETRLVMRMADGPFPMETIYEWVPEGEGTRMTLRNRGEPTGFSKLLGPLMPLAMRRANRKDLAGIKRILEAV